MTIDGRHEVVLGYFFLRVTGSEYTGATLWVTRRRVVGERFFEELSVLNPGTEPIQPEIAIAVGADFAELRSKSRTGRSRSPARRSVAVSSSSPTA